MTSKLLTRRFWEPIVRSSFLVTTGAYLLASYLTARHEQSLALQPIFNGIRLTWFVLLVAWAAIMPRNKLTFEDPGPAYSGTYVVLACGFGGAFFLAQSASWPRGFVMPAAIAIATLGVALIVYRFASKHAPDIGEGRFKTTLGSSDEPA